MSLGKNARKREARRLAALEAERIERLAAYRAANPAPTTTTDAQVRANVRKEDAKHRHGRRVERPAHHEAPTRGPRGKTRHGWPERTGAAGHCVVISVHSDGSEQRRTVKEVRIGERAPTRYRLEGGKVRPR